MSKLFCNYALNTKEVKNMKKNNKKKGFTLVELIAVIAILAILAAVVVPKVSSYTGSAKSAAKKSDASTIVNAIEVYNAQATAATQIGDDTTLSQISNLKFGSNASDNLDSSNTGVTQARDDLKATVDKVITKNGSADGTGTNEMGSATKYSTIKSIVAR